MRPLTKQSVTIIIILLTLAVIWILKILLIDASSQDPIAARTKGDPQAPVQVVEYIDFQCPACAYGAKMLKEYMEKNPDQLNLQLHHFPLAMHKHAVTASIFAECAARQQKFWPYHDLLIENQDQWKTMEDARPAFRNFAQEVELDVHKFERCIDDPATQEYILQERSKAADRGIRSTPTYFVNGEMVVGAPSLMKKLNQVAPLPTP